MKYLIIIIVFVMFVPQAQSQTLSELLQEFNNLYALEHSEFHNDPGEERKRNSYYGYVSRIRLINVDNDWLDKITIEIKKDPNKLFAYISSNNYDYSAYALFLHIYNLEMEMPEYVMLDMVHSMVKDPNLYPDMRRGEDNNTLLKRIMASLKKENTDFSLRLKNQLKEKNIL